MVPFAERTPPGGEEGRRETPLYEDVFIFLCTPASGFHPPIRRPLLATGLLHKPSVFWGQHHVLELSGLLTSTRVTWGEGLRVSRRESETCGQRLVLLRVPGAPWAVGRALGGPHGCRARLPAGGRQPRGERWISQNLEDIEGCSTDHTPFPFLVFLFVYYLLYN